MEELRNGIYYKFKNKDELVPYQDSKKFTKKEKESCEGVVLKEDNHCFMISLTNILNGTITEPLVRSSIYGYRAETKEKAENDFYGKLNTKTLIDGGMLWDRLRYWDDLLDNGWYIPSGGQLMLIRKHFLVLNLALKKVNGKELHPYWYWSSTMYDNNTIWGVNMEQHQQPSTTLYQAWIRYIKDIELK